MAPDSSSRVLSRHPIVFEEFKPKISLSHIFPSMKSMFFLSPILLLVIKHELDTPFARFCVQYIVAYVISLCAVCMCWCVFCDVCAVYAKLYMLVCCVLMCVGVWYICILRLCAGTCELCVLCVWYAWALFCVLCFSSDISWEHQTWVCKHNDLWSRKRKKDFTITLIKFLVRKFKGR